MLLTEARWVFVGDARVSRAYLGTTMVADTTTTVRTNLVPNPKPLLGWGGVEYRRNLCTNPTFHGGDASAWGHYAGVGGAVTATIENDGGYSGAYYRRVTWTTASTSGGGQYHADAPGSHTPGQTYAFSGYIRPSTTRAFACLVQWYDDALNPVAGSLSNGGPVQCPAGQWTRVSHVVTAPPGGTRAQVRFFVWSGGTTVGETVDVDAVLIEQADQVRPYFDGSTTYDPLLVPSWTGATGASASVLTAQTPTGWTPSPGETAVLVTDDDGEPCVEFIDPVGGGGGYLWALNSAADTPGVGRWVAFGVDVKPLTSDQASRMSVRVRTQQGNANVDQQYSPGGVGWTAGQWTRQVVSVQQTATADNVDALVLPTDTPNPGAQFRARRAVVAFADTREGAEAAVETYFDGDTPDTDEEVYAWTGTANASPSTKTAPTWGPPAT